MNAKQPPISGVEAAANLIAEKDATKREKANQRSRELRRKRKELTKGLDYIRKARAEVIAKNIDNLNDPKVVEAIKQHNDSEKVIEDKLKNLTIRRGLWMSDDGVVYSRSEKLGEYQILGRLFKVKDTDKWCVTVVLNAQSKIDTKPHEIGRAVQMHAPDRAAAERQGNQMFAMWRKIVRSM